MTTPNERRMASRLLQVHDRGGYELGQFLRWQAKPYLLAVVYLAAASSFFAWAELWSFLWLTVGLFGGMWFRDYGHLLAARRSWPLLDRVIHWEKVKEIALAEEEV